MLVLILDSATPAVTAAVARVRPDGCDLLAQRVTVDARAHGELLAPQVHEVLAGAGARVGDLTAIVAGLGPGPFTGLRVGLVTAASMGQALGIPTYGVCSLDAVGHAARGEDGEVLVATDARRREVYWALYRHGRRTAPPAVDRPADLRLPAGVVAAVGDGALRYADVLRDASGAALPVRDEPRYPPAASLAALAAPRVLADANSEELTPLYLRRPDAVEPAARKTVLP